jgi:hypothetical protein
VGLSRSQVNAKQLDPAIAEIPVVSLIIWHMGRAAANTGIMPMVRRSSNTFQNRSASSTMAWRFGVANWSGNTRSFPGQIDDRRSGTFGKHESPLTGFGVILLATIRA